MAQTAPRDHVIIALEPNSIYITTNISSSNRSGLRWALIHVDEVGGISRHELGSADKTNVYGPEVYLSTDIIQAFNRFDNATILAYFKIWNCPVPRRDRLETICHRAAQRAAEQTGISPCSTFVTRVLGGLGLFPARVQEIEDNIGKKSNTTYGWRYLSCVHNLNLRYPTAILTV
ncbi:hypothetical protein FA95DRAFT_122581 [Auriscalpium vulgare]|uniref:Uncharacterized protein n=1 Tax=Auriscalpium vulgare TaxID=40419 RepID=A0ACB8R040_9AGAM|nr:hypothetical protein FA95DRAFT_122581 [Auriscalpium vulgare]